jgi:hypothetical protein
MATNFPASLDTLTNPTSSDSLSSPSHSAQHANVNDAVEALQVKVGIDSSADTSSHDYLIGDLLSRIATLEAAGSPIVKVAAFTSSGSWTVPAGVTYAVAHIRGGGGGTGLSSGTGGTSSVAFSGGTVSAVGGGPITASMVNIASLGQAGAANSGNGAHHQESLNAYAFAAAQDGAYLVAGDTVTAGASITVTVGAGGTAGTNSFAGGSGYVWIEYQES